MKHKNWEQGQVMLLSIIVLGGIMLSAATIGGLLVLYQIRQVNDAESSAKALFAADAGIELASYCFFKGCGVDVSTVVDTCNQSSIEALLAFEDHPNTCMRINPTLQPGELTIVANGFSGDALRILETVFVNE